MFDSIINGQKALKTFVFQKEETQQSIIIDYQIDIRQTFVNLNYILSIYCSLQQHRVSIYDPNSNKFVSLLKISGENGFIHKQYLQPRIILIRYKRGNPAILDQDSMDSGLEFDSIQDKKDGRSKQRTIAEVIQLVKRWRNLHLYGHKSINRRMNLQDAARLVGISKKSLDDYYCQLRLGQFYEFDFSSKLQEKMGVLRSYVKQYKPEKDLKRHQNQKHPKNLKVIQDFQLETKTFKILPKQEEVEQNKTYPKQTERYKNEVYNYGIQMNDQKLNQENEDFIQPESNQLELEMFNLEHQFFKTFEAVLDEPNDPYFQIERDFSKKDFMEDSNSFLYF